MRKNQTLLVAGILLLASTAVAQAQGVYEVFSNPVMARTGGAREMAGDVVLFLRTGAHDGGVVTVRFSAPLAEGLAMGEGGVTVETRDEINKAGVTVELDEGTVTITMPAMGEDSITLSGVRLDVREAEAPVTAMFSGDSNAFLSGAANVISAIGDALEVGSTSAQILTRGGIGSATLTLKEAFSGGFTAGADVLLTLVGVPAKAIVTVSHPGYDDTEGGVNTAGVAGVVTLTEGTKEATIVSDGMIQAPDVASMLPLTGDGNKINITVGFDNFTPTDDATGPNAAKTETLKLMFDLVAEDQEDLMLPLDEGKVEIWVTMAPTEKPSPIVAGTEYFALNYMPADGVVAFTIAPASCTLLFPYAAVVPAADWNTGIAISNPSAFTDTPLSGDLTFTLFPNDGEMFMHSTDGMSTGEGLDEDGSLPAGKTYTVLLSEVLSDAGMPGDFIGHLYVRTNFTGCRGVGWITNWTTVNQAYLPYFGDNLDEGEVPANNTKSVEP